MKLSDLRKEDHLSSSSINDYFKCGLLYKFGRIDRLPMEFKPDAMEFGSAIHLTLGEFYQFKMVGDILTLKEVQKSFETKWRLLAEGREDIKYSKGKDFETYLLEGKELLAVWYSKLPDDDFNILSIEEAFSFTIPGISIVVTDIHIIVARCRCRDYIGGGEVACKRSRSVRDQGIHIRPVSPGGRDGDIC